MKGLKHYRHGVGQNAYHLVWKPKYAKPMFHNTRLKEACEASLNQSVVEYDFEIYEVQVMPDHVHLFIECPPTIAVSKALQLFKGRSAHELFVQFPWLRYHFRKGHFWSPGKFWRSVGNVTVETIQHYIAESQQDGWAFNEGTVSSYHRKFAEIRQQKSLADFCS